MHSAHASHDCDSFSQMILNNYVQRVEASKWLPSRMSFSRVEFFVGVSNSSFINNGKPTNPSITTSYHVTASLV